MNWKAKLFQKAVATSAPILSRIIPKKRNYFVFIPTHDRKNILSGNSLALLQYIENNHPEIDYALVLLGNKDAVIPKEENGLTVKRNTLSSYWSILRAEHIILDMIVFDPLLENGQFSIIQLWHGTGFKNIVLLTNHTENYIRVVKNLSPQIKLVVATSESDTIRKNVSFQVENARITGSPRNDVFFKEKDYFRSLRKKYKLENYDKVISYAPTFRDEATTSPFSDNFWKKLNDHLVKNNEVFIVKKHPWDKHLIVPSYYSNIKDYSSIIKDPQELLLITNLLISDYSGIITDFVIMDKPVLLYMYDLDMYLESCRSMYYDLEEILPKPFMYKEEELLERITTNDWMEDKEYKESYNAFKNQFHKYLDGNSSKRVTEEILKL
ncbi:CDP-glycerol glycerophosphotransferase family protein [Aequorivita capsosiphonis]|uniref:CDP-glycerol glycerophosphotransferase family protein n=1 Tax=Aequorivita capsosiphonis TaxID=487317 RepID=UPI000411C48B|nr:CDP-glycerol glycerophosphotransferase family protein [Aequorivita capsosiphonis]